LVKQTSDSESCESIGIATAFLGCQTTDERFGCLPFVTWSRIQEHYYLADLSLSIATSQPFEMVASAGTKL
jgi:hypothetical protein